MRVDIHSGEIKQVINADVAHITQGTPFTASGKDELPDDDLQASQDRDRSSGQADMATHTLKVFISYAHADNDWLAQLQVHLKPMLRAAKIDAWSDQKILPGTPWETEIRKALTGADVGILLITPAFLASDYIFQNELPELLKKKIIWIAVRHSGFQQTEIAKYQAVNDPAKPLSSLSPSERDKEWVSICEKIKQALLPSE